MTPQDRFNQFMALVDSGATTKEIAYQMKVQTTYVSGAKTLLGIEASQRRCHDKAAVVDAYASGLGVKEIAARHNISKNCVSKIGINAGLRRYKARKVSQ